ncbi:SDR family oxidoreductase [Pectobacterium actinidiae]|uniref:SDR family oxidoreductase n=1 Tax=Pectobacterium actinidiae TaxID=1507808 RepID=A0A1V2R9R2_9GAMM|nr:SDR family oxidoreductase [Pectobacterium actinidiae]KHN89981.1 short-chain dehydrogenase/reductase SDR [Pectobacterium actinidiae]ONK06903.1 SDR family oxidoreductase [Pectobacterium actinidiae]ONK09183.1 SDR family oxidoreductase [Pectobacterium actinidiae]WEF12372.1 SDR family oxidoreductase [Pectobacterium actinidiae]
MESHSRLKGKTALITGSARGIGKAIAERFAAEGATLIGIHDVEYSDAAEETAERVRQLGTQAVVIPADFASNPKQGSRRLWAQFSQVLSETGSGLDILVNNAGISPLATIADTSDELYDKIMAVNVTAPFFLIQAAGAEMRSGGSIINISSARTRIAASNRVAYAASKGAINVLTLSLAPEYGARDITVNAIAPGVIDTEMVKEMLSDTHVRERAERYSVFSRLGQPNDIAAMAVFLASIEGRWVTGQVLDVSGGSCL